MTRKRSENRDRAQLTIDRTGTPELFAAIEPLKGRARGQRLKVLATLGLRVESLGFSLQGGRTDGVLLLPSSHLDVAKPQASNVAAPLPTEPANVEAKNIEAQERVVMGLFRYAE